MQPIIKHFTDDDLYKFTMCCAVIDNYPRTKVKYHFKDRDNTIYPKGFASLVEQQVAMLEDLRITDEEIDFMKRRCNYIPNWFYTYLRGFRYDRRWVKVSQDEEDHLNIEIEGLWADTILLEVKILAIVSELYYIVTEENKKFNYEEFRKRTFEKGERLFNAGCVVSEFGTRRRASFEAQDIAVATLKEASDKCNGTGYLIGTSNVYLAMKYDLTPTGTMAHELVCAIAGMYGPLMANHIAMNTWAKTYRGALGTFLYDTYGWKIFSLNFSEDFANEFKGLRVDSGDNREQLNLIIDKYKSLGIDPRVKQIIFSNALNVDKAIELHKEAQGKCLPSFGIGTHFTNEFPGVKARNIVIKLTDVKITERWGFYSETCKLSEDHGKYTGNPEVVRRFLEILHI